MSNKVRSMRRAAEKAARKEQKPRDVSLSLRDLVESVSSLNKLASSPDHPAVLNYRLGRLLRQANAELQSFNDARQRLFEKHGELQEGGDQYRVPVEKVAAFQAELNELLDADIELTAPRVSLRDATVAKLTGLDMAALYWLIEDPDDIAGDQEEAAAAREESA